MRDGILDQLPQKLASDKMVVICGPKDHPGLNKLRDAISGLNRRETWIKGAFQDQIDTTQVSARASIVLTMTGLTQGALANARRAAERLGVCCPNQALTISETKQILYHLSRLRAEGSPVPGQPEKDGDISNHGGQNAGSTQAPDEAPEESIPDLEEIPPAMENLDSDPDEVMEALAAIERFQQASKEAELAVISVGERLKEVTKERDELQEQLEAKRELAAKLTAQDDIIARLTRENADFFHKNARLESELSKVRGILEKFQRIAKEMQS